MIGTIISGVAAALESVATWLRLRERNLNEQVGALKQREADKDATIKAKDDQLRKAVNARDGDFAKRLRSKDF